MLMETIEEPKQADHAVTAVIFAHTAMVFVLDVLTPVGIAIWALHVFPLGFTRWSMRLALYLQTISNLFPKPWQVFTDS